MTITALGHPMASASLIEVMDYLALRLADAKKEAGDIRELRNAIDRFDEAYMWVIAALTPVPGER